MRRTCAIVFLAVVLSGLGIARGGDGDWVNISDGLFEQAEGYSDLIPGGRGTGGLKVDRHSGDLFVCLNGPPFGVWTSQDAGETWTRLDEGEVVGGWTRSKAICFDENASGKMAFFRVFPPPGKREDDKASSGYTLDGGKTWTAMTHNEYVYAGGGWVHGMVDFSADPVAIIAQSRAKGTLFVSTDGGQEWTNTKINGVLYNSLGARWGKSMAGSDRRIDINLLKGYALVDGAILAGYEDGISRSTDMGKEFTKVSDFKVTAETPVELGGKLYWLSEKGVIVSDDGGKSWQLLGSELSGAAKGPLFGEDASTMVVVTENGVYKTTDEAKTWKKISDLFWVEDTYKARFEQVLRRHDYGWDPQRNILYVSGMAGSAYKRQLDN